MSLSVALTNDELAVLRHPTHSHSIKPYLSITPSTIIAAAQINQSVFPERVAQLTLDNTSGNWSKVKPGMTLWIGTTAGTFDVGIYRVRGVLDGAILEIAEMNSGDPGIAVMLRAKALADNQYVSVINDVNLHALKSRIEFLNGEDGVFYKDYDLVYTSQTQNAVPCWVNLGQHRAGWVNSSNVLVEDFSADVIPFLPGDTVLSYFWEVDGGTITIGTTGSQNITVQFSPGHYLIWCTVGLSNGAVMRACRHVFAHKMGVYEPYRVNISTLRKTRDGVNVSLTLQPDKRIGNTPILSGTMCVLWEDIRWSDDVPSALTHAPLWLQTANAVTILRRLTTTTFELQSTAQLVAVAQFLDSVTVPTNWQEAIPSLMHLEFWAFYLLHYHSTALMLHDVVFQDVRDYTFITISESPGSLFDQAQRGLQRLNMQMNQRHDGTLVFTRHPFIESMGDRNARPERMTLTEADVIEVSITRVNRVKVGKVELYGFIAGSTPLPVRTIAFGVTGGQGLNEPRIQDQLVLSQDEINERAGMIFAMHNNPYERVSLKMARNWAAVIEPAEMYFVRVTLPATVWPEGVAFNERVLVKEVSKTFRANGVVETHVTIEVETSGVPGRTMPINLGNGAEDSYAGIEFDEVGLPIIELNPFGNTGWSPWPLDEIPASSETPEPPADETNAIAWTNTVFTTAEIRETSPTWAEFFNLLPEIVNSLAYSSASPFFANPSDALYLWILTDIALYYSDDALAVSPTFNEQQTGLGNYTLLRQVTGVAGGIAAFGGTQPGTDTAFTGDGANDWRTKEFGAIALCGNIEAFYDEANDRVVGVDCPGNDDNDALITKTFQNVTRVVATAVTTNTSPVGSSIYIYDNGSLNGRYQDFPGTSTLRTDVFDTGALTLNGVVEIWALVATRYSFTGGSQAYIIRMEVDCDFAHFLYSSDNGVTITETVIAPAAGDTGGDVDDFGLGVAIVPASRHIYYSQSYTGAFARLEELTGIDGLSPITCIRIPYRKLASQSINNSKASLQFIYGVKDGVDGKTLWGVTFNANTGALIAESDMTPIIDGTTYYVVGPNALETAGANTQIILAFAKPIAGGDTVLILSTNGGTTWTIANTGFDGESVRWEEGSTKRVWFAGASGIGYSNNRGLTIVNRSGTLAAHVKGVFAL